MKYIDEYNTIKAYIDRTGDTVTFPFKFHTASGDAVIDDSITYDDYLKNPEIHYSQSGHKFTDNDLRFFWKSIVLHRMKYRALLLVMSGQYKAINPAIEYVRGTL